LNIHSISQEKSEFFAEKTENSVRLHKKLTGQGTKILNLAKKIRLLQEELSHLLKIFESTKKDINLNFEEIKIFSEKVSQEEPLFLYGIKELKNLGQISFLEDSFQEFLQLFEEELSPDFLLEISDLI